MSAFFVCEFAKNTLSNVIRECFGADFPDVVQKRQVGYFFDYLTDLGAKSILVESDYIDKDFFDDFSRYYVKCFKTYGSRCARIHFFAKEIDHSFVDDLLVNYDDASVFDLQSSYLGFMVIKPLPQTFVGRTCLRVYQSIIENDYKRLITRKYDVNLFGIGLTVDTLAFQEQDKVLAACATTAIWSVLHAVNFIGERNISSCGKITTNAINHIPDSSNSFPNNGLSIKQILRAIDNEGLRYHLINLADKSDFGYGDWECCFDLVRTYIDSGVPLLVVVQVYSVVDGGSVYLGNHAISLLGYSSKFDNNAFYIHDDRIGAFVRAKKSSRPPKDFDKNHEGRWCLEICQKNSDRSWLSPSEFFVPISLVVPTDKKVRVPYKPVKNTCDLIKQEFDLFVADTIAEEVAVEEGEVDGLEEVLNYKIRIANVSDYKREIYGNARVKNKAAILTINMPRFQWVATFVYGGEIIYDLLFDATDIPHGNPVNGVVVYNMDKFEFLTGWVVQNNFSDTRELEVQLNLSKHNFLKSFMDFMAEKSDSYESYLNNSFGFCRMPKYIKSAEVVNDNIAVIGGVRKFYSASNDSLAVLFGSLSDGVVIIWAISHDGALLLAPEQEKGKGHPSLTGFKPARIAGELHKGKGVWFINHKSGRYSGHHSASDCEIFLRNAAKRVRDTFKDDAVLIFHPWLHIQASSVRRPLPMISDLPLDLAV